MIYSYEITKAKREFDRYMDEKATEKRKEEVRRVKASLDNGENFRANLEPNSKSDDGFNWDMFKNEH